MKLRTLYLVILLMGLVSCKGTKNVVGSSTANSKLSTKSIVNSHHLASPNFKTMAARVQVVHKDEKKEQGMTVSLRIEKDKKIWIKGSLLGITIAKVYITPDRVSYYETISNTYFDGDFSLLSKWLGTEIDFRKAQDILLGQSIFGINASEYGSAVVQNKYRLQPNRQASNFIHSIFLNPDNFKVASGSLSQPNDNRLLTIWYGEYQNIEGGFYPSEIRIEATEKEGLTQYDLNFKKIDLNVSITFPFTIPNGYEEIQLNQ